MRFDLRWRSERGGPRPQRRRPPLPVRRGRQESERSVAVMQRQLPLPWTEFVGRERERASLTRLLLRARLVTVVGLSGVGKSRLARQVAQDLLPEFAGQVWFVPCEGLANAAAILPILA